MPRLARLDAPGILHHVIIRGIERRRIFRDNKDQDDSLARLGYDLERVEERGCGVYDLSVGDIYSESREKAKSDARGLFCYWAARELGISHTALAKKLEMSLAGVGFSVERGETIAKKGNYSLEK